MTENKANAEALPENPAEAAQVDDVFFHLVDYLYRRRKFFITLLVAVFALILGGLGVYEYLKAQDKARDVELYRIEQSLRQGDKDQALAKLSSFAAEHQGTDQARMARFWRANLLAQGKDYLAAEQELNLLLEQTDPNQGLFVLVQVYLSNLLRDQDKLQEALSILNRGQGKVMQDAILAEKAEAYMLLKQPDQAKAHLNRILDEFPDSLYRQRAQQLLKVLQP